MSNYIVEFEFRYTDVNKYKDNIDHITNIITLGIYETKKESYKEGNRILENIYEITKCKRQEFFGDIILMDRTVMNGIVVVNFGNCMLFGRIIPLKYNDILSKTKEVLEATKRVRKFKLYNEYE